MPGEESETHHEGIAAEFRMTRDVRARIREREIKAWVAIEGAVRRPGRAWCDAPGRAPSHRGASGCAGPGGLPQGDRRLRSAAKDLDTGRVSRSGVRRMLPSDIRRAVVEIR